MELALGPSAAVHRRGLALIISSTIGPPRAA
jgi:hypothetical protein